MNIHIANLSVNVIDSDLVRLFSVYGVVDFVVIVRDKKSGRSKGNAFLEMPFNAQGEQAIRALHESDVDGLKISVHEIEYKAGDCKN
jgi:RNA recognition motif-containing protein